MKKEMDFFGKVRWMLGASQGEIARYTGVSKSAIKMAEISERSMPLQAMVKLEQLFTNAETGPKKIDLVDAHEAGENETMLEELERTLQLNQHRLQKLEQELAKMILESTGATETLRRLERIWPEGKTEKDLDFHERVIASWAARQKIILYKNGTRTQAKVRIKMAALMAEMAVIEQLLAAETPA